MKHEPLTAIPCKDAFIASLIFILRNIFPKSTFLEHTRKKNYSRITKYLNNKLNENGQYSGQVFTVERHNKLSEQGFIKKFHNNGIPVIFSQEAMNWGCTKKWSLDFLSEHYGDEVFSVIDSTGLVEPEFNKASDSSKPILINKISAREFVTSIKEGAKYYLRGYPILENREELLGDLDLGWLKKMRRCFLGVSFQTFIGSSGRTTPMHCETTSFFFIMADGEKKWVMYESDSFPLLNPIPESRGYFYFKISTKEINSKYPDVSLLNRFECHLKKGDILFVPAWMWHEVENLTNSWRVSYRFTSLKAFLKHPTFVFTRVFLSRPSIIETFYYSFFRNDISKRDKNLLTPKIYFKI